MQKQDRIEKLVVTEGSFGGAVRHDILDANLEGCLERASPLPYAYEAGIGRIISEPHRAQWVAHEHTDDDLWANLPDSTVAFVTPAANEDGQGDRDARYLVQAANAVPRLLRRIRELEAALGITPPTGPVGHLDVCHG